MRRTLELLGAVDTVTGSRSMVTTERARVLVDCGLFQGPKKLRQRNWARFPGEGLDAVVLTHAHVDHSGYLPRLCKDGYTGPVYCTRGTRDLLHLLLPDAGHLQEEEARHANRWGYSRHHPALPLFTREEAERCLDQLVPVEVGERFDPAPGISGVYRRVGHILGAASLVLDLEGTRLGFSGDVGRPVDPIMKPPEPLAPADYLVVESTYGDRLHAAGDIAEELARVIVDAVERRGALVIPSFAVGRAQHVLHLIATLREANRIPDCPVYLDSPMAIDATKLLVTHAADHVLSPDECARLSAVAHYARTADDSKAIDATSGPKIIIAASGMCTGGRVLHHLQRFLPDERSTVLFVGYQAAGTRGRTLLDGAAELKLLGQYVPVRARVIQLDGLSAHADHAELLAWLGRSQLAPRRVFVTHGEPAAADALRRRLVEAFGWDVVDPELGESYKL